MSVDRQPDQPPEDYTQREVVYQDSVDPLERAEFWRRALQHMGPGGTDV